MRTTRILAALTAAAVVLLTACANQKEPAEKAVAQIESSLAEVRADAEKYAADELKSIDETVNKLKGDLAAKNYKAVVVQTPTVTSKVTQFKAAVATKKAEAEELLAAAQQEWTDLSTSVPELVGKLQTKVDSLVKSKKLPKGMDKAAFETAKADFEAVKTSWSEAASEFTSGLAADAVRKARAAKAKSEQLVQKLGA